MGTSITLETKGLADLRERIVRLGSRVSDLSAPSRNIGEEMMSRHQERMARGIDIHGRPFTRTSRAAARGTVPLGGADHSLANSVRYSAGRDGIELYSSHISAAVHQEGKTIRPKTAKYLTIPMRARGGSGYQSTTPLQRDGNRGGYRARDYKNTFFRTVGGRLYLFQRDGAGAVRALFILLRSVTMKKNQWFGFTEADQQYAIEIYGRHVDTFDDSRGRV